MRASGTPVVLPDGSTVRIRPIVPADDDLIVALWKRLSAASLQTRLFAPVPLTDRRLDELVRFDPRRAGGVVATLGRGADEHAVGLARFDLDDGDDTTAEYSAIVEDRYQGRGIGTALLRELAQLAQERGVERLTGDILASNARMLRLLDDLGLATDRAAGGGIVHATVDVAPTGRYLAAVAAEEKTAATHALERFLRPRSIAVVGASRTPGTIGHLVLDNLLEGGFTGVVYPVNPHATAVHSVATYPSLSACPGVPDLVIVAVPAPVVGEVIDEAGELGVRAVCVVSAGFSETGPEGRARQADLLDRVHGHGMRLIGPNCMGVLNAAPDIRMNATFSRCFPGSGRVSFLSQSGALGLSVLERFAQLGVGISSFVSVGNKADISGNDLLLFWEDDAATDVVLLYLESFGNPRRFARIARRIGRAKPIVAVKAGRTTSGRRGAASHTAAVAAGDTAVDALFHQAGVIRTDSLEEMFGVTRLLASGAVPRGPRVAVLTNGGGPGILAADACEANDLTVPALSEATAGALAAFLPGEAGTSNPIDVIASASAEDFAHALRILGHSGEVDAVLVVFIPPIVTRAEDVARAVLEVTPELPDELAVVAVFMSGDAPALLTAARVATFAFPEEAARALGHVVRWSTWCQRPEGAVVRPAGMDPRRARAQLERLAADADPEGMWLTSDDAQELLTAYGIPLASTVTVTSGAEAADAQRRLGGTVVVKSAAAIHKSDVGAVVVGVDSADDAARAVGSIASALRASGLEEHVGRYLVQPQLEGAELVVGVTHDPSFGPLVVVGFGGTLVELVRDVAVRITPLTDVDVDEMLTSLRTYPLLTGYRGAPPTDLPALRDLLHRVSAMVEDLAEIGEMDLNPVFVGPDGVVAVDVRVRVQRTDATDANR
jgi:acetate---CoA ligase (ADP-forming)